MPDFSNPLSLTIRAQLERQVAEAQARTAARAEQRQAVDTERAERRAVKAARQDREALAEKINRYVASLPPWQRAQRMTVPELIRVVDLRGADGKRYTHMSIVGPILDSLGWTRGRDWTTAGKGRRWVMPPQP